MLFNPLFEYKYKNQLYSMYSSKHIVQVFSVVIICFAPDFSKKFQRVRAQKFEMKFVMALKPYFTVLSNSDEKYTK